MFRPFRLRQAAGVLVAAVAALAFPTPRSPAEEPAQKQSMTLDVDLADVAKKVLHARLVIPVKPGPLTLQYPKWIPGEHAPTGPVTDLVGLKLSAGGKRIAWQRDDVDMFAFQCAIPEGVEALEVALDLLLPANKEGFSSAASSTARLAMINWNQVLLYPRGQSIHDFTCRASLTLPAGWQGGTALPVAAQAGSRVAFVPVSLETLVDSPVLCGRHFREVPIGPTDGPRHYLVMACESEAGLDIAPELKAKYDRLIVEALALFGTRHYKSYRFLLTLSDQTAHFGLEHHECTDVRAPERMLLDDDTRKVYATLLPHEYVHSWNGKYRRPADMITDDFQKAQHTRLLWVYEGLTQYLGMLLTARSGLWTPEEYRERLAHVAEWAQNQKGRAWRPLEDTTVAAQLLYAAPGSWAAYRRSVDFYDEGVLLWLEVDTLIRQKTRGAKSLDDFCCRFHGGQGGAVALSGYALNDVVKDLEAVAPDDWKAFFTKRLGATDAAPLEGVRLGGWQLAYADTPSALQKSEESENKNLDLTASLGLLIKEDGSVQDTIPDKPADKASVGPGMKVVAVNGRRWSGQGLRTAIAATKKGEGGLQLLVENGDFFRTYKVDYQGGEKYVRLEREASGNRDLLADILKPLKTSSAARKADDYKLGPDSQEQEGVPHGKVTKYSWTSTIFPGTVRDYWVYVPAQYDPQQPACVMVFQDGNSYQDPKGSFRVPIVFDNLIHKKEMPVTIGIFINPGTIPATAAGRRAQSNRSFEYDTLSDQYARFLEKEILPEVGKNYNLRQDAEGRAIGGISSGGICAFTAAWQRPDLFSKVLSHVGSFTNIRGGDVYPGMIRKTPRKPIRVFLQDGSGDLDNEHGNWPLANQQMALALKRAGYDYKFEYGDGGHNGKHGGAILPDSLRWLWRSAR